MDEQTKLHFATSALVTIDGQRDVLDSTASRSKSSARRLHCQP
jgi:hypothetical protein